MRSQFYLSHLGAMAVCLLTVGCSAIRNDYVEPGSAPLARLSVVNKAHLHMRLDLYDDPQTCSGRRMVIQRNSPLEMPTRQPSIQVKANEPLTFTLLSGADHALYSEACAPTATFTPKPNENYLAEMIVSGDKCLVTVSTSGSGNVPSDFKQRRWRNGRIESSSFCHPDQAAP